MCSVGLAAQSQCEQTLAHLAWANFSPGTHNSGNLSCLFFKPLQTELLCAIYQGYQDFVSHRKKFRSYEYLG